MSQLCADTGVRSSTPRTILATLSCCTNAPIMTLALVSSTRKGLSRFFRQLNLLFLTTSASKSPLPSWVPPGASWAPPWDPWVPPRWFLVSPGASWVPPGCFLGPLTPPGCLLGPPGASGCLLVDTSSYGPRAAGGHHPRMLFLATPLKTFFRGYLKNGFTNDVKS